MDEHGVENGSAYIECEDDSAKSVPSSLREFPDSNFDKTIGSDASPRDKDYQRYYSSVIYIL
jgi:hypothetical protein